MASLTQSRYTDTELDPYNAERGFWWVSDLFQFFERFRPQSLVTVPRLVDARETKDQAWTS